MKPDGTGNQARSVAPPADTSSNPANELGYIFRTYDRAADIPLEAARALLLEHGHLMHDRMVGSGGPSFDIMLHLDAFFNKIDQVLPPNGRFYLVWNEAGQLVATGALRKLSDEVGEMKHLYVKPQTRGAGLGRELVMRRIEDARAMGLKTLVADTFAANPEMPALYDRIGFLRVPPSDISGTSRISPELADHMLFFRLDL